MGKSCLKKIFKRVFVLILCVLVSGVSIVSVSGKAYAASTNFLSDETINKFIELFYDAGGEAAEGVYDILSGEKEGTYEEFKSIYKNISAFYGVIDKSEVFAETAARDAVANISRLNDIIGGCILIYDNAASFANSTNAVQKTVDGFQILKGAMSILGCGSYFPSGISLALNVTEITINLAGYLETQYFKENVAFYEIDLQMAYFTGSELPYPEAPNVIGFKLTQEEADSIYAQTYMKYYIKQMMDRVGKSISDDSGNSGNSITGGIVFDKSSYYLSLGETIKFTSSYYSSEAQADVTISYTSSDKSIFTVSSDGFIKAVGEGAAQLIATASTGATARCNIVVYPFSFSENDTGYTIDRYSGSATEYSVPSRINGIPVTSIGDYAFGDNTNLTSITIPDTVTNIGENAFTCCTNLSSVTISEKATTIDDFAFYGCTSLTYITIPDSVTSIGEHVFEVCENLSSVTIGNSVISIGEYAFYRCTNLTSLTVPASVKSIGEDAFYRCDNLSSVYITDVGSWCEVGLGGGLYYGYNLYLNGELITDLVIPEGVTRIESHAFEYCTSITSVTIPSSVTFIGDYAFEGCTNISSVYIKDIGAWCEIEFGDYGANPMCFADNFYLNGELLTDAVIPDGVTSIPKAVFDGCTSLTSITIPDSVTSIGDYAFSGCSNLTSVTIGNSVTSIGDDAFAGCNNITSITLPDSVTDIGDYAFFNCTNLKFFEIPSSVRNIGRYAFRNCESLPSITIPDSTTSIGDYAFEGCTNLAAINVDGNNANYSSVDGVLFNKNKTALIQYPAGKIDTNYVIPDSVISIEAEAFYGCSNLESIIIPDSVTNIGEEAFWKCNKLVSIMLPDGITNISDYMFYCCSSLESVFIPDSVTNIGDYAFDYCSKLITITIPDSVKSIGDGAFSDCGFATIIIPNNVTNISRYAFYGCENLVSITIPDSVTSIGSYAFGRCNSLTSFIIPEDVTKISMYAFWDCTNLESITIPNNVTKIDSSAFKNCGNMKYVFYSGSQNEWNDMTIGSSNELLTSSVIHYNSTDHNYGEWVTDTEPTCTIPGTKHRICEICDYKAIEEISVCSHTYSTEWTIDIVPTCTEEGSKSHHCTVCGDKTDVTVVLATGHNYEITNTLAVHPHTVTYICSYCDDEKTEMPTIPDCIECIYGTETPIKGTENTKIDFNKFLIFTSIRNCSDIIELISVSENATVEVIPSFKNGVTELYGTGTMVTIFDGDDYIGDFTLIVEGDTNGDGACNVLDVFDAERASSGHLELEGAFAMAADSNSDDTININDYQAIVNKALAS